MRELIKFWVQKTKEHLKETEREKEVRELFLHIFGCEPEIRWRDNGILVARKVVSTIKEEYYILGCKVWEIEFRLKEVDTINLDADWKFNQEEEETRVFYKWEKQVGRYKARVEIKTIK